MEQIYRRRMERAWKVMKEEGIESMFITPSPDLKYFTGCSMWADERLMVLVISPDREPFAVANKLYEQTLSSLPYHDILYWLDGENPFDLLGRALKERSIPTATVAVDDCLSARMLMPLMKLLENSRVLLSSQVTTGLRLYKDAKEIEIISASCNIASEALRITLSNGRRWIGHTENELAVALCNEMVRLGMDYGSASVSSGTNSAEAHHLSSNTVIRDNTCMWIDFGGVYCNYCSDMTRAFFFGSPDPEYVHICDIVNEAREAGIAAAVSGSPLHAVDDAAREVIGRAGYGQFFTHRTGHGIGIMNHEGPSAAPGEQTVIAPGMTFSVEPGIYIPGRFGVRIEDQVLIKEDGLAYALHDFPTQLTVF